MCQLPCMAGIGLRASHYQQVLEQRPALGWVEVHSENFFGGGAPLRTLRQVAEQYPVSLHGVGMGLASPDPLDAGHLRELRRLCDAVNPASVSEHLCWNTVGGIAINDLLPFPYTRDALTHVADRIRQVQDALGRRILIENLSYYVAFRSSEMREEEFLTELVARTGCGILFDVNNLFVNAVNLGVDADAFIHGIPAEAVGEYHLAGPSLMDGCLVDTHSAPVFDEAWDLYEKALRHIGKRPTLIEWDVDIPALEVLQGEACKAQQRMDAVGFTNANYSVRGELVEP
ncbi:MAG: DUF692 domain-containing protein [Gallionella sp.]|nr:DUF692 domain-containing protein [Gallionella sp.]MDD4947834.1 DUF692 domain-containing protein [Gallionella sp.]MDD5612875.1 DUF692 domain-containing protein [Gallionella sp.]